MKTGSSTILALANSSLLRGFFAKTGLYKVGNYVLGKMPISRRFNGVRYRISRLESVGLSREFFNSESLYGNEISKDIKTFADLGSNVGYFTCWLQGVTNGKLRGIMVDANPDCATESQWHVNAKAFGGVVALRGLAGSSSETTLDFYVHRRANMCSTMNPPSYSGESDPTWRKISTSGICLEQSWLGLIGDVPCDVLKIDIEGAETKFLENEKDFLKRTKTILIEWHKWCGVTLDQIKTPLQASGFTLGTILNENESAGMAVFNRVAKPDKK
jgi:FkbM family methyltransferase